jgi:ATP-dependent Clp protease ATP-binding subunit ClpB
VLKRRGGADDDKAAEAIQAAAQDATRRGNPALEDVHVLMALLGQEETVVVPVLQKVGVNVTRLREAVTAVLERLPKQTGGASPT